MISFIPLPFGHESGGLGISWLPDFGLYAATANINVTLALTIMTFGLATMWASARTGSAATGKSLMPTGCQSRSSPRSSSSAARYGLDCRSVLRLVSLSVRLFANILAGHMLIIMAAGFAVLARQLRRAAALPFGVFFYFLEWVLVAGLQAFIFAMLSGIYIGFAVQNPTKATSSRPLITEDSRGS